MSFFGLGEDDADTTGADSAVTRTSSTPTSTKEKETATATTTAKKSKDEDDEESTTTTRKPTKAVVADEETVNAKATDTTTATGGIGDTYDKCKTEGVSSTSCKESAGANSGMIIGGRSFPILFLTTPQRYQNIIGPLISLTGVLYSSDPVNRKMEAWIENFAD